MKEFYKGKRVLVTGHTGFKGTWMLKVLSMMGAEVTGYSLPAPTEPSLFDIINASEFPGVTYVEGDIRDISSLMEAFDKCQPEIVIHMAAQPIVRESYNNPVGTYETNVMGTVNVLECVRKTESVRSFVNVTTDKVYYNREWEWGYRECDELNGYDPYSNSKSCSELVTSSYRNSLFTNDMIAVADNGTDSGMINGKRVCAISTCRAGNVIGGGDFAKDRIIPDCVRAAINGDEIVVRNPWSTRPYQHVLEPVMAYLMIAAKQYEDMSLAGCYNIGPDNADCIKTGDLVSMFCDKWGTGASWRHEGDNGPHEAGFLKLDCSKAMNVFGWMPKWHIDEAVDKTVEWYREWAAGNNAEKVMELQIADYLQD